MYVDIQKVIYGLPQADKIANDKLKQYMAKFGYDQVPITPRFWWKQTRTLQFV